MGEIRCWDVGPAGEAVTSRFTGDGAFELRPGDRIKVQPDDPRRTKHRGRRGVYKGLTWRCAACHCLLTGVAAQCRRCGFDDNRPWPSTARVTFDDTGRTGQVDFGDLRPE